MGLIGPAGQIPHCAPIDTPRQDFDVEVVPSERIQESVDFTAGNSGRIVCQESCREAWSQLYDVPPTKITIFFV